EAGARAASPGRAQGGERGTFSNHPPPSLDLPLPLPLARIELRRGGKGHFVIVARRSRLTVRTGARGRKPRALPWSCFFIG
ncbi:Hypothetical predicted protein, partial [Marmota monax]